MSRVVVRVDAVKVSASDRPGVAPAPGRLEAAVRRAIERTPSGRPQGAADVPVIRVRVERRSAPDADQIGAAIAEAIGAATHGRGGGR